MQRVPHFRNDFTFRKNAIDPVTKAEIVKLVTITKNTQDLRKMLNQHVGNRNTASMKLVYHLKDFLERCFLLDPSKRMTAKEALKHPFVEGERKERKEDGGVERGGEGARRV